MTHSARRKRTRVSWWRWLLFGVLLLIAIALGAFFGYTGSTPANAWKLFVFGADIVNAKVHAAIGQRVSPFHGKQRINILLLGVDVSTDPSGSDCRTDTIKLVSADFANSTISVMSIPRDTWVEIPNHGYQRINGAYPLGGRREADRVTMSKTVIISLLSQLTGQPVHIDRYVRLQTGGFDRIIDAMGGIDIDVEKQMDYDDPSQLLSIHLKPGMQHLNGRDAEGYIRFRHDAEGDYGRMRRQNQFMWTMIAQLRAPGMRRRLPQLIGPIMSMMYTDLRGTEMLALKELAEKVGVNGIHTCELPTVPCMRGAASVVEVRDTAKAAQVIRDALNGPRPTVIVLNGANQPGVARTLSEQIDATQFQVLATGTTRQPIAATAVIAPERCKAAARRLAKCLGIAQVTTSAPLPQAVFDAQTPSPPPADITVVLGSDYLVPTEPAPGGGT